MKYLFSSTLDGTILNWRRLGDGMDYACPIQYNSEYRQVETQGKKSEISDGIYNDENACLPPGV